MSSAPRPRTTPSRSSPANGGRRHSAASAGTTSRCPWSRSAGARPAPRSRATTFGRAGSRAATTGSTPASASSPATNAAHSRSLPGGLLVSKRSSRCSSSTGSAAEAIRERYARPERTRPGDCPRGTSRRDDRARCCQRRRHCGGRGSRAICVGGRGSRGRGLGPVPHPSEADVALRRSGRDRRARRDPRPGRARRRSRPSTSRPRCPPDARDRRPRAARSRGAATA
jgi:hypothetical protein